MRPARDKNTYPYAESLHEQLPENGVGAMKALQELINTSAVAAVHSTGPKFFHLSSAAIHRQRLEPIG